MTFTHILGPQPPTTWTIPNSTVDLQEKINRIEAIKAEHEKTPILDEAGIYTAAGIDAAIRIKTYEEVLRILMS